MLIGGNGSSEVQHALVMHVIKRSGFAEEGKNAPDDTIALQLVYPLTIDLCIIYPVHIVQAL